MGGQATSRKDEIEIPTAVEENILRALTIHVCEIKTIRFDLISLINQLYHFPIYFHGSIEKNVFYCIIEVVLKLEFY